MNKRYVDIDDVLDLFGIEDEDIYAKGTIEDALYDGTLKIYKLSSAERHGHWKIIDKGHNFYDWECSICGGSGRGDYTFCPRCGAIMDLEAEE